VTRSSFTVECNATGCDVEATFELPVVAQREGWSGLSYDVMWQSGNKTGYCPDHNYTDAVPISEVTSE